ncbi:MAG: hypothetical protein HOQ05_07665 [Corynebacteriales bacterium]|nr:hypothetical protein [Mycobacteriales bacterium]
MSNADHLLVVLKPEGARLECSGGELEKIAEGWQGVVQWLRGGDFHHLSPVVNEVILRAATRMPTHLSECSINEWMKQASGVEPPTLDDVVDLGGITTALFRSIGFTQAADKSGALTEEGVRMLYGENADFAVNTQEVLDHMLEGPVQASYWEGENTQLAQAVKMTIRAGLNAAREANGQSKLPKRRNYIHVGYMHPEETTRFLSAITPARASSARHAGVRPPWQGPGPRTPPHGPQSRRAL